jgi:hypothetical protein
MNALHPAVQEPVGPFLLDEELERSAVGLNQRRCPLDKVHALFLHLQSTCRSIDADFTAPPRNTCVTKGLRAGLVDTVSGR